MESFFITVGYGSVALLGTAIGVALLEHWRRPQRGRQVPPPPVAQRAAHVDVDLSALEVLAASATTGDQARRQATVSAAMARMAEPAAAVAASVTASVAATEAQPPWIETRPMVGMAPETEPR